jgi:AcrR family transcriptional regulator
MVNAELAAEPRPEADGRRLRREQNRDAVIDALLALFREGSLMPSSADVAARAGLSPRSLFRYFDDIEDLHRAAIARMIGQTRPRLRPAANPHDPTAVKISAVVGARAELYEQIGPAGRALRAWIRQHNAEIDDLNIGRSLLLGQLTELFEAELTRSGRSTLPAMEVLLSFESYERLRHRMGLTPAAAREALVAAFTALLGVTTSGAPG